MSPRSILHGGLSEVVSFDVVEQVSIKDGNRAIMVPHSASPNVTKWMAIDITEANATSFLQMQAWPTYAMISQIFALC